MIGMERDVPDDPEVVAPVPAPPEPEGRIVVRHAADHVFGGVDTVHECPEAEEAPGDEELFYKSEINFFTKSRRRSDYLEPDNDEVPEADHGDLGGGGADPSAGIFDGDDVHEVEDEFHDEEICEEAEEVGEGWG